MRKIQGAYLLRFPMRADARVGSRVDWIGFFVGWLPRSLTHIYKDGSGDTKTRFDSHELTLGLRFHL